jgi:hypothetical protein
LRLIRPPSAAAYGWRTAAPVLYQLFIVAMTFLSDQDRYTVALRLRQLFLQLSTDSGG